MKPVEPGAAKVTPHLFFGATDILQASLDLLNSRAEQIGGRSALPPKADTLSVGIDVCLVPITDISSNPEFDLIELHPDHAGFVITAKSAYPRYKCRNSSAAPLSLASFVSSGSSSARGCTEN